MGKIGIIGGSGVEELIFTKNFRERKIRTKYGLVPINEGKVENKEVVFLLRHGKSYALPSEINYRANIAALKKIGVDKILCTAAVGAINRKMHPGDFAVLTDFIDFTKGIRETFTRRSFIDVSQPYDPDLNKIIVSEAKKMKVRIHPKAIYACTEGPRFETKAEIAAMAKLGCDVVGMTQVPEVVLAKEVGIPYAAIAVVTNYACGITKEKIDPDHVVEVMREKSKLLSRLLSEIIRSLPE
ncbi:MAG: MTAP family purine nucleoside phosphorylase [Candidatus Margulisiibacteriota bacterium]